MHRGALRRTLCDTAFLAAPCWLVQRGIVALANSVPRERMVENLDIFGFHLDDSDMARVVTLETGESSFFSHWDPAIVKWMSERRLDVKRHAASASTGHQLKHRQAPRRAPC